VQETELTTDQVGCVVEQVARALDLVMAINPDELLAVVQAAHESKWRDQLEPAPQFEVSRQALRMFWRFRNHLEGVRVMEDLD
jgi:hypothetical protein